MHAADIQDRDGGILVMATLFGLYPFLLKLYADAGDQGPRFRRALRRVLRQVNVEIVTRSETAKGFPVLPKRCRNAGSSNEPSAGSTDAVGWPRTGNASTARPWPSSAGRQSG